MVSTPIANNTDGTIVIAGYVANLDTSAFTDGDKLYLSPSVAGGWTATKPSAPDNLVYVGVIARAHPTLGVIQLRISNGFELDELHDVSAASPSNSDLLAFETSTNLWKNKSAATLGLAKLASPTLTGTPLSTTAAADTNTTQIATTAFVVGQASSTTPAATGTAAVGTSLKYARADHVHANPLPTGGTANQVLSKVDSSNYNVQWVTPSSGGGGGGVDVQTFGSSTTSGSFTWTKPSGAKFVEVYLWGAGGGGGSGARRATTSGRAGGSGGQHGTVCVMRFNAAYLSSTETVVVGSGGTGGASVTTDDTNGNNSGNMANGSTTFRGNFQATFGNQGNGGTTTSGPNGSSFFSTIYDISRSGVVGGTGTLSTGTSAAGIGTGQTMVPTSGGGGAGAGANLTANANGGSGASLTNFSGYAGNQSGIAGGSGGNATTQVAPTAGTTATNQFIGGTGGGGGFYRTGQAGCAGANGGWPGGGGGGGSASDNGFASGKGGDGANGFAIVITYF
jgi:hypothetical protein